VSNRSRRLLARALAATTLVATGPLFLGLTSTPAIAAPTAPTFGSAIEDDAPYQPQQTCDAVAKVGVLKFRDMVLKAYPGTGDSGITRACSDGGRSEHKDGRAWDWTASVSNSKQVAQVNDLLHWLFATDKYGNKHAMARRLGIMYIIWNAKIWNAGSDHWDTYSCSGTTACHKDHVHFSFGWAGALAKTSYWTGHVTTYVDPPVRVLDDQTLPATVRVDSASTTRVLTPFALPAGHHYVFTATGTFTYGSPYDGHPRVGDAECSVAPDDLWHSTTIWEGYPGHGQLDLYVGDHHSWAPDKNNGHGCSLAHRYTQRITTTSTSQLAMLISDSVRTDNHGVLTVTITRGA
jgi:hypothetical protein